MNLDRFAHLLDVFGSDLTRWPDAERIAAEELLGDSESARSLLAEAAELDAELSLDQPAPPSEQLILDMGAVPELHPRRLVVVGALPFARMPVLGRFAPTLALAAAVALGLFVGNWAFPAEVAPSSAGRSFDEAADASDEETAELFELAFASDESVDGSALYVGEELP